MNTKLTWDYRKRQSNLLKHGLDFEQADEVLSSRFCLHLPISKLDEPRVISFSYVLSHLCVLALVHNQRHDQIRLISFRKASREETIAYFRWLEHERIDSTWSARKNASNQPRPFLCLEWSWSRRPTSDPRTISAIGVRSTLIWLDHHLAPLSLTVTKEPDATISMVLHWPPALWTRGDPTRPIWSCAASSKGQAWS